MELKSFADTTHVLGSETSAAVGNTYLLVLVSSVTGVHLSVDLKGFDVVTMMRRLTQKVRSAVLSQLASRLSVVTKFGASAGEGPFSDVKDLKTRRGQAKWQSK